MLALQAGGRAVSRASDYRPWCARSLQTCVLLARCASRGVELDRGRYMFFVFVLFVLFCFLGLLGFAPGANRRPFFFFFRAVHTYPFWDYQYRTDPGRRRSCLLSKSVLRFPPPLRLVQRSLRQQSPSLTFPERLRVQSTIPGTCHLSVMYDELRHEKRFPFYGGCFIDRYIHTYIHTSYCLGIHITL